MQAIRMACLQRHLGHLSDTCRQPHLHLHSSPAATRWMFQITKTANSSTCTAHAAKSWPCSFRAPQARHADSRQMSINEHDKLLSVRLSECLLCSTFLPQKASMQGCKVDQAQAYEQVNEHPWHPTQAASAAWHSQGLGAASSVHAWQDCTHTLPNTPPSASRVAL